MTERIDAVSREIFSLATLLKAELDQKRVDPYPITCQTCTDAKHSLNTEKTRNVQLVKQVDSLRGDIQSAGDLIESLKDEIRGESDKNEQLRRRIDELNKELQKRPTRDPSTGTFASSVDLDTERRKRMKVEAELEMYRKQTKGSEPQGVLNAKRIAIALASHCLELSREVAELRGDATDSAPASETLKNFIFHNQVSAPPVPTIRPSPKVSAPKPPVKASGWDLDDDDLFDALN